MASSTAACRPTARPNITMRGKYQGALRKAGFDVLANSILLQGRRSSTARAMAIRRSLERRLYIWVWTMKYSS